MLINLFLVHPQIHPQGHSFLSRNINYNSAGEWLCVHSIIEEPKDITDPTYGGTRKRTKSRSTERTPAVAVDEASLSNVMNALDEFRPPRRRLRIQNQSLPNGMELYCFSNDYMLCFNIYVCVI